MATTPNNVSVLLRKHAKTMSLKKAAANGSPDRLTVADGQGGITTAPGTVPKDPGEADLKADMPADGTGREAAKVPGTPPDRLTVADGQGGITTEAGTVPTDPGEAELKADMPADGTGRSATKSASSRLAKIRQALVNSGTPLGERIKAAAPTAPAAPAAPAAEGEPIEMSDDTLAKVARAILSTDEGVQYAHATLEKQAGEAAARAQIIEATEAAKLYDHSEMLKSAAVNDVMAKAAAIEQQFTAHGVSEEDCAEIIKQAADQQEAIDALEHPMLKAAYAQGMDDATLMGAADEAAGEEGVPPMDEAIPMGGEELGEEEIMQLLQELLASGEITPEDVEAAVAAEGGGEAPLEGGEMPPAEAPVEGAPVEEMPAAV